MGLVPKSTNIWSTYSFVTNIMNDPAYLKFLYGFIRKDLDPII